nr:MAG TPA: hypothetical protein [Caudoviricetes sp.]
MLILILVYYSLLYITKEQLPKKLLFLKQIYLIFTSLIA